MYFKHQPNSVAFTLNLITCFFIFSYIMVCNNISTIAQNKITITKEDSLALESIIVEKYYVTDSSDYKETTGGVLQIGTITYRIYIDMKPEYNLQLIYGNENHELFIQTSTTFFNNVECNALTGFNIDAKILNRNSVALDSWITMGAATRLHTGILKSEDDSVFSFISNKSALCKTDGLIKWVLPNFQIFNIDLNFFNNDSSATRFSTNNGGWAALGGVKGPNEENKVLIAQLTTNGILSFGFCIQMGTPSGYLVQFVPDNPKGNEIQFNKIIYK